VPEGPEIRRAADRIAKVLVGERVEDAWFAFDDLKHWESELEGRRVTAIDTRGKAMLTRFDNDLTIYSHNQLYGRWYTCRRDKPPSTKRSLRVALHTRTHSALLYSASDVDVLAPEHLDEHPFLARVGPDILDPGLKPAGVASRLAEKRFRNRGLGALYLDQAYLAGIGNYLRSEILFVGGEQARRTGRVGVEEPGQSDARDLPPRLPAPRGHGDAGACEDAQGRGSILRPLPLLGVRPRRSALSPVRRDYRTNGRRESQALLLPELSAAPKLTRQFARARPCYRQAMQVDSRVE